jgi:hypothetical protein
MAKAALEAVNGMNVFGKQGGNWSVVLTDIDAHYRNRTTVNTILPRESASKVLKILFRSRYYSIWLPHASPAAHMETFSGYFCEIY